MIPELGDVVLSCDFTKYGLNCDDIGRGVLVHTGGIGQEVAFTTAGCLPHGLLVLGGLPNNPRFARLVLSAFCLSLDL